MSKRLAAIPEGKPWQRGKYRYVPVLAVVTVMILAVWVVTRIVEMTTYPDARREGTQKSYSYTRVYNVEHEVNLQSGINLGCNLKDLNASDWGLVVSERAFNAIRDAGFHYVRIPVQFLPHLTRSGDGYQIDKDLFVRLDGIIDSILQRDMVAILDFHFLIPENQYAYETEQESVQNEEQFLAVWSIVAERYRDYSSDLYFELANEPHRPIMPDTWNAYVQKALDLIRSSGGNNETRTVVVGTSVLIGQLFHTWDNVNGIQQLQIPSAEKDPNIIVTFHYYNPVQFTYQGETYSEDLERFSSAWLGNTWTNTDRQRVLVRKDFDTICQWAQENKREVILGEFGATVYADIDSQANWTRLIREEAESRGMVWIFWQLFDNEGDTLGGIYNQSIGYWKEETLRALMPEADSTGVETAMGQASDDWNEERVQQVTSLVSALQDFDWKTRMGAITALEILKPEAQLAIPALIEALKDEEWQVRRSAAEVLASFGSASQGAVPILTTMLTDAEWQLRQSAARALSAIGPVAESAVPALIEALTDEEWQVRIAAAQALCAIGPAAESAVPALIEALTDEEWQVRIPAAQALSAIGSAAQPAVPALVQALADSEWSVRKSAAEALPAIGSAAQSAVPALIETLTDGEWQVRRSAVLALTCIAPDDPDVIAALQQILSDPERQVRQVASLFLQGLNGKPEN